MSFLYIISAFEVFLKDSINLLIRFDPEYLKRSEKKLSFSEVFNFNEYDELTNFIADKIVYDLGFKSISEQIKFLNKEIKINLSFKNGNGMIANRRYINLESITENFSTRNILLHNGGIVNKRYLDANSSSSFEIGEKRKLSKDYLFNTWGDIKHYGEAIFRQSNIFIKDKKRLIGK